jgi:uncharacterized protein YktA (UPF0223 family)
LHLESKADVMFLAAKCKVSENILEGILNDLAELGEINHKLWTENKIVYSEKFIENIEAAYERRNNKPMHLDSLCAHLIGLGVLKKSKSKPKGVIKPHTILDNTILDNSIEDKTIELFDRFWNIYDKKTSRDKCLTKFKKLKPEEMEKIFSTIEKYIESTPDKQYRKNPETYLNNKCWNDEIIVPKEKEEERSIDNPLFW